MKVDFKNILIFILILVVGYFFVFGGIKGDNTHTSSLVIEEVHDTIIRYDTIRLKELVMIDVKPTDKDTILTGGVYDLKEFEYEIKDSLLNGTIFVTSILKPEVTFKYSLKSFEVKDSIVIQPPTDYSGLFYGGSLAVKPFGVELYLDVAKSFKNGNMINVSVGRHFELQQTVFKVGILRKF